MNKSAILKITGIVLVLFILMLGGAFFLYPQINEEKYNEIVTSFEEEQEEQLKNDLQNERNGNGRNLRERSYNGSSEGGGQAEGDLLDTEAVQDSTHKSSYQLEPELQRLEQNEIRLHGIIDSLYAVVDELEAEVDLLRNPVEEKTEIDPQDFADRVKSLLNLEEDELGPILEKMTKDQIVRLYKSGGTIQRQKILRSLDSDAAAKLMTEIMI